MRLLLDTHVLIWWTRESRRLPENHRDLIRDPLNDVLFSAISVAEIELKVAIGKLDVDERFVPSLPARGLASLSFTTHHAAALRDLPLLHRDPFDRMLVAQARSEGIPLLTLDPAVKAYDIATF